MLNLSKMFKRKIKLNLCPDNAFKLAEFIINNDLLDEFKGMAMSTDRKQSLEEMGFDVLGKVLLKAVNMKVEIGELFDSILGVKNSLKAVQIGEIFEAIVRDNQIKAIKSFFASAFKQAKE